MWGLRFTSCLTQRLDGPIGSRLILRIVDDGVGGRRLKFAHDASTVGLLRPRSCTDCTALLAGLEDVTPHTLRHSFGKHALDAEADLVCGLALQGHQRLETTAIYTAPSQRDLKKVVEKLEQDGNLR